MTGRVFGVVLVGPGMISEYHLNGLAATGRTVLRAVVGRGMVAARTVGERFGAQCVTRDLNAVLRREDVDAVIVATPDDTHEAIGCAALTAGKAVLLQKPMARDAAAGRRLMATAQASGADLQVSFMHRYFDEVEAARDLLARGAIGTVTSARMRNATTGPDWGEWFFDAQRVGLGVVAQLGVHGIDLLAYLLGPITSVSATLETLVPERRLNDGRVVRVMNPDSAVATYRLASGALASHEMSMVETAGCDRFRLEIYGTEGTLWLRSERGLLACAGVDGRWNIPSLTSTAFGQRQHERWLDGLAGVLPPEATALEALGGMHVMDAIARSARAGGAQTTVEGG